MCVSQLCTSNSLSASVQLFPEPVRFQVFSISIKLKVSFFVPPLMSKRRPVQMKCRGCSIDTVKLGSTPSRRHFSLFPVFFCGFHGQLVAGDSCPVSQRIWTLEWRFFFQKMQTGRSRFKILKVRQAGTVTRGGDFNRCHSCRPPSKALNSRRSGMPSAFVGEGMSKKLRPALTQMFAYLYLARVLNIFCSALGGITNKASVTRIFHEKKKVYFFPEIFLEGSRTERQTTRLGVWEDRMELNHLSCSTPWQQRSSGLFSTSLTRCLVSTVTAKQFFR